MGRCSTDSKPEDLPHATIINAFGRKAWNVKGHSGRQFIFLFSIPAQHTNLFMRKNTWLVAALLCSSLVNAQQEPDSTKALNEIVVTATKYPIKLSQTGKVLSVISNEQIEQSAGKDLSQLLTEQTGMLVSGAYSNPGKDKSVFLRGASNDYTLILLDGVPINDPSGSGGAFDLRLLPLDMIERVEILKGSQSTLYGSDAIAGVINIITRKAGNKKSGASAGASYGSYNTFKGNAGINGATSKIDYNLMYSYTSTDGISEAEDKTGNNNFDKDAFARHSFQSNINIKATDKLTISPYYRYSFYKGDFDADAFTDGPNKFDYLLNNTGAIAKLQIPKGSITANYGYSYAKRNYTSLYGDYGFNGRFQSSDVFINQRLNQQVQLLGGVNFQTYQLLDSSLQNKNPKTSILSPYLSFLIQNGTGLGVEVGGRYNYHSKFGSSFTYSVNTSYTFDEKIKLFANVSTGFKAPTVTELFGLFGANENLKPERSNNLEGGIQTSIADKKVAITATVFKRDIKDLITYIAGKYTNVDRQKDKGFELETSITPTDKGNIKLSYTFVDGNISQSRSGKDTSYYNLIRRPKHTVNAMVGYQVTKSLFVSLSTQSLSRRTDLFFQPAPPYGVEQVSLKAYTLLNAYAEYKLLSSNVRLFIDLKNLTDEDFTEVYGYSTQGFNANGGFRITF